MVWYGICDCTYVTIRHLSPIFHSVQIIIPVQRRRDLLYYRGMVSSSLRTQGKGESTNLPPE
jgi:hypothetical protein